MNMKHAIATSVNEVAKIVGLAVNKNGEISRNLVGVESPDGRLVFTYNGKTYTTKYSALEFLSGYKRWSFVKRNAFAAVFSVQYN